MTQAQKGSLKTFVDRFVTCSLQNSVQKIVSEVQIHHHSKSCRKYGTNCRFSYPRFPSKLTIIAEPLQQNDFSSEAEYIGAKKRAKEILGSVQDQLLIILEAEEDLDKISIEDILKEADVSENEYYNALSISDKGTKIVLKRRVSEILVNNYNEEWLRAWNGNMDMQACLDFFAVSTYVTDYYTKDE